MRNSQKLNPKNKIPDKIEKIKVITTTLNFYLGRERKNDESKTSEEAMDGIITTTTTIITPPPPPPPSVFVRVFPPPLPLTRTCNYRCRGGPYVEDLHKILKEREDGFMVKRSIIFDKIQGNWWEEKRRKLVLLFIEHRPAFVESETIFLAINILDRYSEKRIFCKAKTGLIGMAVLFIAAKYRESESFNVLDFSRFVDDIKKPTQALIQMESSILKSLDFKLECPTVFNFLGHYLLVYGIINEAPSLSIVRELGDFFIHMFLGDAEFLDYKSSHIAAAALLLAVKARNLNLRPLGIQVEITPEWGEKIKIYTQYTEDQLKDCMRLIRKSAAKIQDNVVQHEKLYLKYYPVSSYCLPYIN